ncbi:Ubiquitin-conjugating enzyme e2 z [Thalictrum thalictroides]|uniref:E2 ubiquitin-conjugating enzyme n=1 Tax=Thalictrum thalictroides TaxID=46969 RepID=A0A7J6V774_THATH|nr:Ubiquitin-conjugating enzyme e2 z [Thalictrum thalictroides]
MDVAKEVSNIYRQDIVMGNRKNDTIMIGIVTEVAGDLDSDSDSSNEHDDDDEEEEEDDEEEDDNGDDEVDEDENDNVDSSDGHEGQDGKVVANGKKRNDYDCSYEPLPADQVRIVWIDHTESTQNRGDVTVIDRVFFHGDIVAAVSDPTGQVGVVSDVNISVDLLPANGSIVKDISSKYVQRVREFTVGDYVVLGPWLGKVDDVLDDVTVLFDDGSMCKVTKADPSVLKPCSKSILEDGHFPYYPGQRVRATSSSVFKNARWLSGVWKARRMEATVTKVTVGSVFIYWIASAGYGPECATTPAEEQSPKNLKLLSCFAHASWQVGDWCFLPSPAVSTSSDKSPFGVECNNRISGDPESDHGGERVPPEQSDKYHLSQKRATMDLDSSSVSVSLEPVPESRPFHRKKLRKVLVKRDKKPRKKDENYERALMIVNTKTRVDVVWQDGRRECGIVSTTLIPIENLGDQEFVAEQYVVEKATEDNDDMFAVRRVGVVRSVNAKERTACVRWLKPVAKPEDPREFDKEEVVSVYELERHPDYDYCYGDVVIRLTPVSISAAGSLDLGKRTDEPIDLNESMSEAQSQCEEVEDASNTESYADFSDLSWVGNISGLKDGDIEVTWADGMISTVGPQAIYVVGRDDDESIGPDAISDDDAASWETVNDDEMDAVENADEEAGLRNSDIVITGEETTADSEESNSVRNGPMSIPLIALGFLTRLATGLFLPRKKQIDPLNSDYSSENESETPETFDASEIRASSIESSSRQSNANDSYPALILNEEQNTLSEASDTKKVLETFSRLGTDEPDALTMMQSYGDGSCSFKHFDTAKDPLDHFFLGANGQSNSGRKWLKKVQQDWSILQKNLPDSIYVRIYEDRMDLIRAVIVGAYGTPYQDGLFVFDFHLPPEYPQVPPSVHYHSGGWRINPNLYEEGKVCLSLLNTWSGKGNEVWDPSSSSILQVLVSLQGLVLNSKPYFNEAGYDKQVGTAEGEKNSLSYNENTFLLNCKSIMYLARKPPKDFEELIKDHFRRRGYYILKACDAYMKGYLIGTLKDDASLSDKSNENSTSVGFKLMLTKIMPKLVAALSDVGADVHQFKHLQ